MDHLPQGKQPSFSPPWTFLEATPTLILGDTSAYKRKRQRTTGRSLLELGDEAKSTSAVVARWL